MTGAFIDANVPLYVVGREHPLRRPCERVLEFAIGNRSLFSSSAEVLQELLNAGLRRQHIEYGERAMRALRNACGAVEPVFPFDVFAALALSYPGLSARDRVHLAVMNRVGCTHIVSADRAFDSVPGITRLDPLNFDTWRDQFLETG